MLSQLDLRGFDGDLAAALARPTPGGDEPLHVVREIIDAVRMRGDAALRELTKQLDGCDLDDLRVPSTDLAEALNTLPPFLREALEFAQAQITTYHRTQLPEAIVHEREGIRIRELPIPVERAGLYVPGGRAAYPSTVLMTAIPAQVAGVSDIALCVPPDSEGCVPQATLAAAALLGVDEVYRVGGAQAIAAMAYGSESIRPVDMIVGPGNVYVSLAKREVSGVVGIEATAGPSELVVIADETTPPEWTAIDLMAQAEHGPNGAAVLVTWNVSYAASVEKSLAKLVADSSRRSEIESTLAEGGRVVLVDSPEHAVAVSNAIAPEHLQLMSADPEELVPLVRNAGAVFCGPYAPTPVGDYVAGVNHVLPTNRTARFSSALRVDNFLKHIHVVDLDEPTLARVSPYIAALAEVEGLAAHGDSVKMRGATT